MANERRLIDLNELGIGRCNPDAFPQNNRGYCAGWNGVIALLETAPTVNAVEVRCKDCKYYFHYGKTSLVVDGKNVKAGWCQRRMRYDEEIRMLQNDFCSYGEKREVE